MSTKGVFTLPLFEVADNGTVTVQPLGTADGADKSEAQTIHAELHFRSENKSQELSDEIMGVSSEILAWLIETELMLGTPGSKSEAEE